jgi:hypothetical protein
LLAGRSVVRERGRIGRADRLKVERRLALDIAETAALQLEARKRRRAYC